jgi:hypothetical protein
MHLMLAERKGFGDRAGTQKGFAQSAGGPSDRHAEFQIDADGGDGPQRAYETWRRTLLKALAGGWIEHGVAQELLG